MECGLRRLLQEAPHLDGAGITGMVLAELRTVCIHGADERSRTSDLLITNQLLYQLSYNSLERNLTIWIIEV